MIGGLLPSPRISPDPNFSLRTNAPQIFKIKWFGDLIGGGKLFVQIFYPKMNPQKIKKWQYHPLGISSGRIPRSRPKSWMCLFTAPVMFSLCFARPLIVEWWRGRAAGPGKSHFLSQ